MSVIIRMKFRVLGFQSVPQLAIHTLCTNPVDCLLDRSFLLSRVLLGGVEAENSRTFHGRGRSDAKAAAHACRRCLRLPHLR